MKQKPCTEDSVQGLILVEALSKLLSIHWHNRNLLLVSAEAAELNDAINLCKKSVVIAETYIKTRVNSCSVLLVKNIASLYELTICSLLSKSLGLRISTILGRAHTFMMSHDYPPKNKLISR